VKRLAALAAMGLAAGAGATMLLTGPQCFDVRKVNETASTITLGWDRQQADGYRFYRNGVPVSRTFDPARTSARFSKPGTYRIEVLKVTAGISGVYPEAP
jgi:hypothetical protein